MGCDVVYIRGPDSTGYNPAKSGVSYIKSIVFDFVLLDDLFNNIGS